ncbi:MAG: hypothetical protein Q4C13_01090 [Clostridia bacterium]|nr:hypothetical protein [Clostridia bacterium]
MAKTFVRIFIAASLALLLLAAAVVYVFDPLYQYHLPWFGLGMPIYNEQYQNAGLARQLDYDALILGSSMVKSQRASWFSEAYGCKAVMLPFASSYLPDYSMLLDTAYGSRELKHVFLCLDLYALREDADYQYYSYPEYLYDDNRRNDVQYLLNRDVLLELLPQYFAACDTAVPLDEAFSLEGLWTFGRAYALASYSGRHRAGPSAGGMKPRETFLAQCEGALTNITRHIEAHPETVFHIFLPPYSILHWDKYMLDGDTEAMFGVLERTADILLSYENVRLFCFLGMDEVITELDYYHDEMHFNEAAARRMFESMAAGEYELTRENCAAFLEELEDYVWRYDYEALFEDMP